MRRRFVPFVLALLAAACGGDDGDSAAPVTEEASTTTATTEGATSTTAPAPDDTGGVTVDLLFPGSEPRAELRYELDAGAEQEYEQVVVLEQSFGPTTVTLTTTSAVRSRVEAVDGDVATVVVEFGAGTVEAGPGAPPEAVTAAQRALDVLAGTTMEVEMDDRGRILSSELAVGQGDPAIESLVAQLGSTLSQLTIALPDEPVGDDARWRVRQHTEIAGVVTDSSTTYTVVSVDDGAVALDFVGQVGLSGAATGASSGSGSSRFDPAVPLSESEGVAESRIEVQGITLEQQLDNRFTRR